MPGTASSPLNLGAILHNPEAQNILDNIKLWLRLSRKTWELQGIALTVSLESSVYHPIGYQLLYFLLKIELCTFPILKLKKTIPESNLDRYHFSRWNRTTNHHRNGVGFFCANVNRLKSCNEFFTSHFWLNGSVEKNGQSIQQLLRWFSELAEANDRLFRISIELVCKWNEIPWSRFYKEVHQNSN